MLGQSACAVSNSSCTRTFQPHWWEAFGFPGAGTFQNCLGGVPRAVFKNKTSGQRQTLMTKEDRACKLHHVLDDDKLNKTDIRHHSQIDCCLASSVLEGKEQIKTAISMLDFLTGDHSTASDGCHHSLRLARDKHAKFVSVQAHCKTFLARFNQMATNLATHQDSKDPIRRAAGQLKGNTEDQIDAIFHQIDLDILPALPLPKHSNTPPLLALNSTLVNPMNTRTRDEKTTD